jgi:hypothetical protein
MKKLLLLFAALGLAAMTAGNGHSKAASEEFGKALALNAGGAVAVATIQNAADTVRGMTNAFTILKEGWGKQDKLDTSGGHVVQGHGEHERVEYHPWMSGEEKRQVGQQRSSTERAKGRIA